MIAMTFAVYFFVSFFLTAPFVVRYLIVSRREKKQMLRRFADDSHAEEHGNIYSMQ